MFYYVFRLSSYIRSFISFSLDTYLFYTFCADRYTAYDLTPLINSMVENRMEITVSTLSPWFFSCIIFVFVNFHKRMDFRSLLQKRTGLEYENECLIHCANRFVCAGSYFVPKRRDKYHLKKAGKMVEREILFEHNKLTTRPCIHTANNETAIERITM